MKKPIITIEDIEESLCDLDTEYREALAEGLMKLNYISDTPLRLMYGTVEQQREYERIWKKPLKSKQIKEIVEYMSNKMKGDFQYGSFRGITLEYMQYAKTLDALEEKKNKKVKNKGKEL